MSYNVKVNGVDYQGISKVQLNDSEGGLVVFTAGGGGDVPSGGGEKILYMDAALLNAGGAYPVDADDYTTAVIPAEATFVDMEAFKNLPNLDTLIVNGDCEFETYSETIDKTTYFHGPITEYRTPIRKFITKDRTAEIPSYFMKGVGPLIEIEVACPVGMQSFYGCSYLRKISLDGVTSLGDYAFGGCENLAEVTIPDSVTSFGADIFNGCRALSKVNLPDNLAEIPFGMFSSCIALPKITIPDGVTSIGYRAFGNCYALSEVNIPESVTLIGNYAFERCALSEITIPAGVISISPYAFNYCSNLATITILGAETKIDDTTAIPSTTKIRAYAGSAAETFATTNGYTFEAIE